MPLTIYGILPSPAVRTVLITSKNLGISYDFKVVNLFTGEHMKPDYLKLNPLHTVPTIDDNGTVIFDSHAIAPYLVGKYGKDDKLYPKDLARKAIVDQRLHFDSGVLFPKLRDHVMKILAGDGVITEELKTQTHETLQSLETLLGDNDWIAHTPNFTIADIALLSTIENIEALLPYISKHPKLAAWRERANAKIPNYAEVTKEGIADVIKAFGGKVKSA